jgi:starch synthase
MFLILLSMEVLYCASEIYPYAKTGGLADVGFCLIKYLNRLGVKAKGVMPLYKGVKAENLESTGKSVEVELAGDRYRFYIYENEHCCFFKNDDLFWRDFIYGPPGQGYGDNDIRFGGFSKAVAKAISEGIFTPDIVHTNDWQTALIPVFLKEIYRNPTKVVFTIHNFAYQGIFPKESLDRLGLPGYLYHMEALEFWEDINFMKGGIVFADLVTTVSPTYAEEIQTAEYGNGLEGVLRKYSYKLKGILNGVDYEIWNPATDEYIYEHYSQRRYGKKFRNKEELTRELNLDSEKPLVAFINRLTYQKGVDLILESAERMAKLNANFVFFGTGEYQSRFLELNKYNNFRVLTDFNEPFARKLYAAADFILMPSLFEPCGLTAIIGMRYGAIPIVRETGGLKDIVKDMATEENGYGITFNEVNPEPFTCALERAIELHDNERKFRKLVKKVMALEFSCDKMAREYLNSYEEILPN